jgi:outer membrane protein OmpA-like peptidoglycan-associated protein
MNRICFFLLLLPFCVTAQNLVVNPGFENSTTGESGLMVTAEVNGWTVPTKGTSDYIRPTSKQRKEQAKEIPAYAHIVPYDGKACAGFHGSIAGYEYLCGTLAAPLTKDSVYTISFALATAFGHAFDPDRIGIFFTQESNPYYRYEGRQPRMLLTPNVTLSSAEVFSETSYWKVYSLSYTAKGNEQRFIIGDFTDKFEEGMQGKQADYFFIDSVSISKEIYTPKETESDTVFVITGGTPEPVMSDTLIAAGRTLVLENIYFETNKSRILPESYQPLYDIIVQMKLQPELKVEITGHTDKHGTPDANQKLSEERAKAVADFFIAKGIDPSRITTRGEGQSKPVGNNDQKNRRVEFRFYE